jgi:glutamate racemase
MNKNAAIGIFDSGLGGLTVAKEIAQLMPDESLVYVGDQARCPYGPRAQDQIENFVLQISHFLQQQEVKAIVIACNTATSCGIAAAQSHFDIPIVGVINAGARAAARRTRSGKIAVIGTQRTIDSRAYMKAVSQIDESLEVMGRATPELTTIVESNQVEEAVAQCAQKQGEHYQLIDGYLRPLLDAKPDTLLLGCTHYPILERALQELAGPQVQLVCSAAEVAQELQERLEDLGLLAGSVLPQTETTTSKNQWYSSVLLTDPALPQARHTFYTTDTNTDDFAQKGADIFGLRLSEVLHLDPAILENIEVPTRQIKTSKKEQLC